MRVFLIRHPQPNVAQGLCYGQSDLALIDDPSPLAKQLSQQLPKNILLFSSPLLRCRALAEVLGNELGTRPIYDDRLKEMHFGDWEMQTWSAIPRQQLDDWAADPLHYTPSKGESVAQLQKRVFEFMAEKKQAHHEIALVTHAGVMKILFAHARARQAISMDGVNAERLPEAIPAVPLPINEWMTLSFAYGALEIISYLPTFAKDCDSTPSI